MTVLLKRLVMMVPMLIGITLVSFWIMHLAPGDPTSMMFDPRMSAQDLAQLRTNLGLNQPLIVQYGKWLTQLCQGNFGYSFVTGKPVLTTILERLPATLLLSITSLLLILAITLPLGIYSGAKAHSWFDKAVTSFTFLGMAIPTFWLGMMLILVFSLWIGLFPSSGFLDPELSDTPLINQMLNIAWHACLPVITLVIGGLASLTRYHRSGTLKLLNQDFIRAARARGLSEKRILFKHVFKNAALPLVTILGLELPSLIGGAFVVEYVFAWPGMGQLGISAIFSRDYPIIMGILLISSVLLIIGNLLADLAYAWIDPRISL